MTRLSKIINETNVWSLLAFAIIAITVIPALNIVFGVVTAETENWSHIKQYLLQEYIVNTVILFIFSGFFASLIGVSLAYLVTVFDFPLRRFFKWALILPLSIPAYIGAYTYSGMVSYTGVITKLLTWFSGKMVLIDIMSIPGTIFIFTFFLFPYVYIISRAFLAKYTASLIESARMLGKGYTQIFFRVILPVSRGVIASGCALVLMEVANDYGVVSYFGINTFSIAIFKVWFGMGDISSAVRLCIYLMGFIVAIILAEKMLRGQKKFAVATSKVRVLIPQPLPKAKALAASFYCFIIFSLGFLLPFFQLLAWAFITYDEVLEASFLEAAVNTVVAAVVCAGIIVCCSVVITNSARISRNMLAQTAAKLTVVGYSVPGAVISIGVLILFMWLNKFTESMWNYSVITSIYMLFFAYIVRFLAVGCSSLESGFEKVGKTFFEASRTLGFGVTQTFFKVDLKMIIPSLTGAFSLVFVDMAKELPLTLILRPFNFNTLATKVYEYAHDERVQHSAPAALIIIAICSISVYYLSKAEKE
ncbi:iron ABC transporter permease [Sporomusa sp.]|uniref:ABC transporter permease n=1 Tax=Sporomusa sp. TaxID=2078658 RepID=UPI002C0CE14A|nr:iron ABC transporter permease [Sporomusa sp.]HWR42013.1 iron ABC transporter permease [Sporomusa sp.]